MRFLPGKRSKDEGLEQYLTRIANGPLRGGAFLDRELARGLLDVLGRLAVLEEREAGDDSGGAAGSAR